MIPTAMREWLATCLAEFRVSALGAITGVFICPEHGQYVCITMNEHELKRAPSLRAVSLEIEGASSDAAEDHWNTFHQQPRLACAPPTPAE